MKKLFSAVCVLCLAISMGWASAPTGKTYKIAANPAKGFLWDYLLYIPDTIDKALTHPVLFTMNDSGIFDSMEELEQETRERFGKGNEDYIAYHVGVPMVLPLIPREEGAMNAHDLNRAALLMQEKNLKRLDLQVLAMLKDARKQLKKEGIATKRKILIAGFSSAGSFGWKLALLHPEKVLAVVAGGEAYPVLPLTDYEGETLPYPVGVADFKEIVERKFQEKAWRKIPIFVFNGALDYNDPLPFNDIYTDSERELIKKLFGDETLQERWEKIRGVLAQVAPNVQTHTYPKTEHRPIPEDMILFLRTQLSGGPLRPIVPKDTSNEPDVFPLRAKGLYWGQAAPVKHDREHLGDTDLLVLIKGKEYRDWVRSSCTFDIIQDGQVLVSDLRSHGVFNSGDAHFLQATVNEEDAAKLRARKKKTFQVIAKPEQILVIPEMLTLTVR